MTAATAIDTLRLYVIESQVLFGKALCQVFALDSTFQIVGDAECVRKQPIAQAKPDVILLDLEGTSNTLTDVIEECHDAAPQAKICLLSMRSQADFVRRCLAAPVEGFIMKDVTPAELITAVKIVAGGMAYVDPRVAGGLLRRRSNGPDLNELSARETEVVRLVAEGLSNKEISVRLNLSDKTVKNHMGRIFSKLNITARTQAAVHAIRNGLV